jgi:hypothetical protein
MTLQESCPRPVAALMLGSVPIAVVGGILALPLAGEPWIGDAVRDASVGWSGLS